MAYGIAPPGGCKQNRLICVHLRLSAVEILANYPRCVRM